MLNPLTRPFLSRNKKMNIIFVISLRQKLCWDHGTLDGNASIDAHVLSQNWQLKAFDYIDRCLRLFSSHVRIT